MAMPDAARFLQYEARPPVIAGLLHQASNLRCLLHEAHITDRLAILPPLRLAPKHNFGVQRQWRWEHYFDLRASSLTDDDGRRHPLPIAEQPPEHDARALRLRGAKRLPEQARDCPLVLRRISHPLFRKALPVDEWPAAQVELRASERAVALARPVAQHLRSLGDGRFVAVHVRRGDRIAGGEYPGQMTAPPYIAQRLRDQGVAEGAVLYIASDEQDLGFWQPLRKSFRLFLYADFPPLERLVSRVGEAPDNYLLYQVEREVLRQGSIRMGTLPTECWADSWLIDRLPRKPSATLSAARWRMAALLRNWLARRP